MLTKPAALHRNASCAKNANGSARRAGNCAAGYDAAVASHVKAVVKRVRDGQACQAAVGCADAHGILQADGYKGFAKLYAPEPDGTARLREAACWAHLRRAFHDFWTSTKSEIAREALDRIGKFYDIERDINGQCNTRI